MGGGLDALVVVDRAYPHALAGVDAGGVHGQVMVCGRTGQRSASHTYVGIQPTEDDVTHAAGEFDRHHALLDPLQRRAEAAMVMLG